MARPLGSARRPRQRFWPLLPHGCLGGRLDARCVAIWPPGTASTTGRRPGVGAALGFSRAVKRVEAPAARAAPEPVADKPWLAGSRGITVRHLQRLESEFAPARPRLHIISQRVLSAQTSAPSS